MGEYLIDGMVALQPKIVEAAKEAAQIVESGFAAEIIVQKYSEKDAAKRRTAAKNKLYFHI